MANAETLLIAEGYLGEHEPERTPEDLFAEFGKVLQIHTEFHAYCKANGLLKNGHKMKRSKSELCRRRLFIKWYLSKNPNKSTTQASKELARLLFVSETTIQFVIYGYRSF